MARPERYKNKYRRGSIRADWWDYHGNGIYHIEINTANRICWFGTIENQKNQLSAAGQIVEREWLAIPAKAPYASLDEYVIMPDHFHGIVHISPSPRPRDSSHGSSSRGPSSPDPLHTPGGSTGSKNPMLHDCLGNCIRSFKALCTIQIRAAIPEFKWQAKFWDNIILSEKELKSVRQYIRENSKNWGEAPR